MLNKLFILIIVFITSFSFSMSQLVSPTNNENIIYAEFREKLNPANGWEGKIYTDKEKEEIAKKVISLNKKDEYYYCAKGLDELYYYGKRKITRTQKAVEYFDKAISISPNFLYSYYCKPQEFISNEESLSMNKKIMTLYPSIFEAYLGYGLNLVDKENPTSAEMSESLIYLKKGFFMLTDKYPIERVKTNMNYRRGIETLIKGFIDFHKVDFNKEPELKERIKSLLKPIIEYYKEQNDTYNMDYYKNLLNKVVS